MDRKGVMGIIIVVIVGILVVGGASYFIFSTGETDLERHTCIFNKSSLELKCSSELKILLGHERFLTSPHEGSNLPGSYDVQIYTEESNTNLNEIYKTKSDVYITSVEGDKHRQCRNCEIPKDKEALEFFTEQFLFQFRKISVIDIETNKTFEFYVTESRIYPISKDNSIDLTIDSCNMGGESFCMPWDPSGKCFHYDTTAKSCNAVISFAKSKNSTDSCYKLNSELSIGICLAKVDLNECFEYSTQNLLAEKACKTVDCQINGRESYPSELNLSNSMEALEYENCVDIWEN